MRRSCNESLRFRSIRLFCNWRRLAIRPVTYHEYPTTARSVMTRPMYSGVVGDRPAGCTAKGYNVQARNPKRRFAWAGRLYFVSKSSAIVFRNCVQSVQNTECRRLSAGMDKSKLPEPWLRGTLTEVSPVQRAVL